MPKASVSKFFDSYACEFNEIYGNNNRFIHNFINRNFRKCMEIRYVKTIEGCHPIEGKDVIDIGCGPGHYGVTLARKGARFVCGIDFAEAMLDLARQNAERHGVADRCRFLREDFLTYEIDNRFDYAIVMGFMDYVQPPEDVVEKVLSITKRKAFFSFPAAAGFLAWQRKIRYKKKCDLFMYTLEQVRDLFRDAACRSVEIEQIDRDLFVTALMV